MGGWVEKSESIAWPRKGFTIKSDAAAGFPPMLMFLNDQLMQHNVNEPFRKAAMVLSFIFALGLFALIWAPETKGKPLPS